MEHEKEMSHAKAKELSVTTAKAKAGTERAYTRFVQWGNKFCTTCKAGVPKIAERQAEANK